MRKQQALLGAMLIAALSVAAGCGDGSNSGDVVYVAIGASDATGASLETIEESYPFIVEDRLQENLGEDVELFNLGIPGGEVDDFLDIELPVAVEAQPDAVTIFAGPNDMIDGKAVETFATELEELLSTLADETDAAIAIASLPDISRLPRFVQQPDPDVTPQRIAAYNGVIADSAARNGAVLVDLGVVDPADTTFTESDGFHPSVEGHALIADQFAAALTPLIEPQEQNQQ